MTFAAILAGAFVVFSAGLTFLMKTYKFGPFLEKEVDPEIPEPVLPEPQSTPQPEVKIDYIELWAKSIQEFEVYAAPREKGRDGKTYPIGTSSWRNKNPGNIKGANGAFLVFPTYEKGYAYLKTYLTRACTGLHKAYTPSMTLMQAMHVYSGDPEPTPSNYGRFCATHMGKTTDTPIGSLV